MNLTTGTTLQNGKYALSNSLGQGDLGLTLKATQTSLSQAVVLKTIRPSPKVPVDFACLRQRFLESAQRFAQCQHPGLVRLVDLFEESGVPFAVMDYVAGESLADQVQPRHPMAEAEAVQYIRQVGSALTALHRNGLVHQDVKPENLIHPVGTDFVVLVDYRILHHAALGVSEPPTALSNTGFAAIEQYQPPAKLTPATDIYALAATLYFLVTGRQPMAANQRLKSPLASPRKLQPNLSLELETAILSGMELNPQKRPQTIAAWFSLLPGSVPLSPVQLSTSAETTSAIAAPAAEEGTANGKLQNTLPLTSSATQPLVPAQITRASQPELSHPSPQIMPARSRLPHAMVVTGIIAASCGLGLGLSLRLSAVSGIGPKIFNTKQTFPPLENWPQVAEPATTPPTTLPEVLPSQESPPPLRHPRAVAPSPSPLPETSPVPAPSVEPSRAPEPAASVMPSPAPEPVPQPTLPTQSAPGLPPSVAPEPSPPLN